MRTPRKIQIIPRKVLEVLGLNVDELHMTLNEFIAISRAVDDISDHPSTMWETRLMLSKLEEVVISIHYDLHYQVGLNDLQTVITMVEACQELYPADPNIRAFLELLKTDVETHL